MDKNELVPHIQRTWIYAKAIGVDELFSGPTALEASDAFKAAATDPHVSYEELYLAGIRESQYNILLKDFSFFQFGVPDLDSVRFAYFPNPFLGAAREAVAELQELQEYVSEGIIDVDELLHRISEIRRPQHPPLVRYEFSRQQYVEASHPCSHMHLGFHGENRWPVRRYLTAHAFALFIFRIFYLDFWLRARAVKSGVRNLTMDEILETARAECRMLYDDEFSPAEGQRFHLF